MRMALLHNASSNLTGLKAHRPGYLPHLVNTCAGIVLMPKALLLPDLLTTGQPAVLHFCVY